MTGPSTHYNAPGHCVYCHDSSSPLSDEHIIAYGLGGTHILDQSSCSTCASITSKVEQHCLRSMMGNARIRLGLPTRRPQQRPANLKVNLTSQGKSRSVEVSIVDFPVLLVIPRFKSPSYLDGTTRTSLELMDVWARRFDLNTNEQLEQIGGGGFPLTNFEPWKFALMMCKIGHSAAVAALGANSFQAFLPDIILGKKLDVPTYVGASMKHPAPTIPELHRLEVLKQRTGGEVLVVANIQLFAHLAGPVTQVIVGRV